MDTSYLTDDGPAEQAGTQNKVVVSDGSVRIVVEQDGYDYINEARRVEFDGTMFIIESDGVPRGLTSNQFYTFFLTPVE